MWDHSKTSTEFAKRTNRLPKTEMVLNKRVFFFFFKMISVFSDPIVF